MKVFLPVELGRRVARPRTPMAVFGCHLPHSTGARERSVRYSRSSQGIYGRNCGEPPKFRSGETIRIVDPEGKQTRGAFDGIADSSLRIKVDGVVREFRESAIREVHLKYRDPVSNGLLKGFAIGAAGGGVVGLVVASGDACESSSCRTGATAIFAVVGAGIGAASGGIGDSMRQSYTTVFSAAKATDNRFGISPILSRGTRGVKIALRF